MSALASLTLVLFGAQDALAHPEELASRFQELVARDAPGSHAERGAALVALGPDARALLVDELARRPRDESLRCAVQGFGYAALAPWWQAPETRAAESARLVLFSELGTERELAPALALAAEQPDLAAAAVGGILAREPELLEPLATTVLRLETPAATCLLRAVGSLPGEAALGWLGALLVFENADLELCTLSAIEVCAARALSNDETRSEVRERLWSDDEQILRKAIDASARLQDDEALERLVQLLDHPVAFVSASALRALRSISGLSLPGDCASWQRWLGRENTWFVRRAPEAFAALRLAQHERALAAAQEVAQHRLYRRSAWHELVPLLESEDRGLQRAACEALGQLGLRDALPDLELLLAHEDSTVVSAATRALVRLGWTAPPPPPAPVVDE